MITLPASTDWMIELLTYWLIDCESVALALLVARRTNNWKVAGSRPTKVVCVTVLTVNRLGRTVHCGRPPLLLPSCRKLEFRLSALMASDLAWVNCKSGRQSWCYADAFQCSIISGAIYHFTIFNIPLNALWVTAETKCVLWVLIAMLLLCYINVMLATNHLLITYLTHKYHTEYTS